MVIAHTYSYLLHIWLYHSNGCWSAPFVFTMYAAVVEISMMRYRKREKNNMIADAASHNENSLCEKSGRICLSTFTAGFVYFEYVACARYRRHWAASTSHRTTYRFHWMAELVENETEQRANSFVSKCVCNCRSQRLISRTNTYLGTWIVFDLLACAQLAFGNYSASETNAVSVFNQIRIHLFVDCHYSYDCVQAIMFIII